ncbi:Histidine phosphatase superfamily clade-1 [Trinorchestia longiramus]|nr:Histidine phosphatase superfamily clade-1 [Trinorchestia longiramus]
MFSRLRRLSVVGAGVGGAVVGYYAANWKNVAHTSWTSNFTPATPWDWNWDRRDSSSLNEPDVKPNGKKNKSATKKNETDEEKSERLQSKATRYIIFVRHGQYNLDGPTDNERTLTELGEEQARLTGERLKALDLPITRLVYSTMKRATQTALIMMKHMNQIETVETSDLLREGAPIPPEPPTGNWRPETHQFFTDGARIEAAFRRYVHRAPPSQADDSYEVVVCHANVIRYIVCRCVCLVWCTCVVYTMYRCWSSSGPNSSGSQHRAFTQVVHNSNASDHFAVLCSSLSSTIRSSSLSCTIRSSSLSSTILSSSLSCTIRSSSLSCTIRSSSLSSTIRSSSLSSTIRSSSLSSTIRSSSLSSTIRSSSLSSTIRSSSLSSTILSSSLSSTIRSSSLSSTILSSSLSSTILSSSLSSTILSSSLSSTIHSSSLSSTILSSSLSSTIRSSSLSSTIRSSSLSSTIRSSSLSSTIRSSSLSSTIRSSSLSNTILSSSLSSTILSSSLSSTIRSSSLSNTIRSSSLSNTILSSSLSSTIRSSSLSNTILSSSLSSTISSSSNLHCSFNLSFLIAKMSISVPRISEIILLHAPPHLPSRFYSSKLLTCQRSKNENFFPLRICFN